MPRRQHSEQDINEEMLTHRRSIADLEAEAPLAQSFQKTKPGEESKYVIQAGRRNPSGIPISPALPRNP